MTPQEFRDLAQQQDDQQLLDPCLYDDRMPYAFQPRPQAWDTFRDELASKLMVSRADIRIVGSARLGFSMKPGSNLRSFTDTSDIDLVIVNADLFDQMWFALLVAAYPRFPFTTSLSGWLKTRRNELYTGWLTPTNIRLDAKILGPKARPALDLRTRWFNALKQASRYPTRRHEDITGRLYRTWRHAELYHLHSLAELRKTLSLVRQPQ
jgi:hypothetical protein